MLLELIVNLDASYIHKYKCREVQFIFKRHLKYHKNNLFEFETLDARLFKMAHNCPHELGNDSYTLVQENLC